MFHNYKLSEYFDLARRYDSGSGMQMAKTFSRMLYARWRYHLPAYMFGAFGLMTKPLSSLKELIKGDERHDLLSSWAPQDWRFLEEDKLAFLQRCLQSGLPACPIVGVITDKDSLRAESMGISVMKSAQEIDQLFVRLGDFNGILKRTYGGRGVGIYPIEIKKGVLRPCQEYSDAGQLFAWLRSSRYSFSWIIQPKLRPHHDLLSLMPGPGIGTIRINSFRNISGQVKLKWPILKLPAPGRITDNWTAGTRGTVIVAVDIETGILKQAAGRIRKEFPVERFDSHPFSKEQIVGRQLPNWDVLCRLVKKAATAFKELPVLGWDVAITPDGPLFIEANWDFGLDMVQLLMGSGLKTQLLMSLKEISA
jgi:hypothetical protein